MRWLVLAGLFVSASAWPWQPYELDVVRVKDGDTVLADVEIWPGLRQRVSVRIHGINAPEIHTRQACQKRLGFAAKDALTRFLQGGKRIRLVNIHPELTKYAGRINADIEVDGALASRWMVENGYAVPYDGGRRPRLWDCR